MNTRSKIVAAALGLLVAGGAVADVSAATVTKTVTTTHAMRPVVANKTVKIVHRFNRPHLVSYRALPAHRLAPRIHLAHAFVGKRFAKTTVIR